MEATGFITMTARKVTKLLGKAIGHGLEANVRDAYVFLRTTSSQATAYYCLVSGGAPTPCALLPPCFICMVSFVQMSRWCPM
jgi:hypothetical protein